MFHSIAATLILLLTAVTILVQAVPILEERSTTYSGVATFYSVDYSGPPSCGGDYTNNDMVCALSIKLMPAAYSKYCGEKIKITHNGKSITVKVIDSCEACSKTDIDLSPAAFSKLGDMDEGVLDITWHTV